MDAFDGCTPGRRGTVTLRVGDTDTALAIGSGDVPVLSTPRVLAMAEQAAMQALGDCLESDRTTVGSWVEIDHLKPGRIGDEVEANAVLLGVHGRRLEFSVTVTAHDAELAHIRHRRIIVDRSKFE